MSSIYPPKSMLHALSPPSTSFELPSDHISETMGDFFANVIHNSEDREESNKITAEILIRYGVQDTTNARVVADIANRIVYRAPWPQDSFVALELIGYLFATEALLADDRTWAKCKGRLSGGHFSLDDLDLLELLAATGKGPQARHSFWEDILENSQTRRILQSKRGYSLEALVKLPVEHSRVNCGGSHLQAVLGFVKKTIGLDGLTPQERRNIPEQIIWVFERRMCSKAPQVSFNRIHWELEGGIPKS
ncbi:hypothetical protein DFP72DRAFT_858485 [Ephemerocybe angulata]|uniref:Uncharacterized protein n=1 Tax=Ephemerocybe angulata TaxID=980116 RepID=A0A8H6HBZ7_9AGAR|nr:hypothetical protein DFP72DRAFT_858485 [Tulosesus angulatus]